MSFLLYDVIQYFSLIPNDSRKNVVKGSRYFIYITSKYRAIGKRKRTELKEGIRKRIPAISASQNKTGHFANMNHKLIAYPMDIYKFIQPSDTTNFFWIICVFIASSFSTVTGSVSETGIMGWF